MLTFEQSPFLGTANIVSKLQVRDIHHDRESRGYTSYYWQDKSG
jgi:hypothetical protein